MHDNSDSDDDGYEAVGLESDIGDNLEIMENENVQSWGNSRVMPPPKKYFKEDDEDFDGFYEDERT